MFRFHAQAKETLVGAQHLSNAPAQEYLQDGRPSLQGDAERDPLSNELKACLDQARASNYCEEDLCTVLSKTFKHLHFRGPQLHIIQRVLQGSSTLAILPTGRLLPTHLKTFEPNTESKPPCAQNCCSVHAVV